MTFKIRLLNRWPRNLLCSAIGLAAIALYANAQSPLPGNAPPRTVFDVANLLNQYKPDSAKISEIRRRYSAELPATGMYQRMRDAYLDRATAAQLLGDSRREIADLQMSVNAAVPIGGADLVVLTITQI